MGNRTTRGTVLRRPAGFLVVLACLLAALAVSGTATATPDGADTSTAPWIASDKPDYAPGERVTLDGGNWAPGESVRIEVEDDQGKTWQRDVTVTADAAGTISDSFDLPDWFVATYSVKATGSSGAVATSSFTDGNVQAQTNAGGPTVTLTYKRYAATNCTGGPSATQTATIGPTSGSTNLFAQDTGSFSLEVPASSGAHDFSQWTAQANFSSTSNPLCFNAISGNRTFTANYAAAAVRATTTALASSLNPSTYGGSVTFTATVTATGGNPSGAGTVTFRSGTSAICSAVALSGNTATCATSALRAATSPHSITAEYSGTTSGSPQFEASTSAALSQVVDTKTLTGSVTAASKVYDGTAAATITGRSLDGAIAGDDVELSGGTASFSDKNAGTDKPVGVSGASLAGDDGGNYTLGAVTANEADITPLGISGSFTAADKAYDGTTDAEITGRSLHGAIAGDDVSLTGGSASFADKHAGDDKPVAGAGFTLTGDDKDNYTLDSVADTTADITPLGITGSVAVANKVYDGTADAQITGRSLGGAIAGDDVSLTGGTAGFDDENVGTNKPVSVSGASLAGDDKDNYTLGAVTANDADITPLGITGSFTAADKEYDGTADATITGHSVNGAIAGDDVSLSGGTASFDDKHAGDDKPVSGTDFSLAGDDMGNYTLESVADTTASITPKPLTGSFTASDKEYDGNRDATVAGTSLPGVLDGDDVTLDVSGALFDTKDVGTDKDVTAALSLAGDGADNYSVNASHTATADITPKAITGSFTAADKVYDGTADATITGRALHGAIDGDDVSLTGGTAGFDDKHAGDDKPVSGAGFALAGNDKDNYTLDSVADTTAGITRRDLDLTADGVDKVYDGTTAASVTFTDDRIAGDAFSIDSTASFADKHVGDDKPVSVGGISLSGADADNYRLASTSSSTTADITPRDLTVAATGVSKVYDGATDAAVVLSTDALDGDDVDASYEDASFGDPNAGSGKTVSVHGISISGDDAPNYDLTSTTATATADIDPRPITVTAHAKSKQFGAPDPALTYVVTGGPLVDGDGFSGALTRVAGEAVGSYDILKGTVSAGPNYAIAYVGAKLTIGAWHALGFHQPIGIANSLFVPAGNGGAPAATAATVWNTAKGGATIPLKFNVYESAGGAERTSTADVQSFTSAKLGTCTAGAVNDPVEELASAGSTTLRYDTTDRQFIQNWKTPSVSAESCYRVALTLRDGSAIYAFVKLRK